MKPEDLYQRLVEKERQLRQTKELVAKLETVVADLEADLGKFPCVICGSPRTGARTCGDRACTGMEYGDG